MDATTRSWNNVFANNGAWGVLFVPYPDGGSPSLGQTCAGKGGTQITGLGCVFDSWGNALLDNTFTNNGFYGNPSNGDFGQITLTAGHPQNCFSGNTAPDGSAPSDLETTQPTCGPITTAANTGGDLLGQVLCDTGLGSCPPGANYPQPSAVVMRPLPSNLPTMPDPCAGVPTNPWCPASSNQTTTSGRPPRADIERADHARLVGDRSPGDTGRDRAPLHRLSREPFPTGCGKPWGGSHGCNSRVHPLDAPCSHTSPGVARSAVVHERRPALR